MKFQKFEDIIAWEKAQHLAIAIYDAFGTSKDFGFKDQICRAAVSVSNNIAEGFDRKSDLEFSKFLYYSAGSCSEVRSMLYLAEKLVYIDRDKKEEFMSQCNEVSKIIRGLIKALGDSKQLKNINNN